MQIAIHCRDPRKWGTTHLHRCRVGAHRRKPFESISHRSPHQKEISEASPCPYPAGMERHRWRSLPRSRRSPPGALLYGKDCLSRPVMLFKTCWGIDHLVNDDKWDDRTISILYLSSVQQYFPVVYLDCIEGYTHKLNFPKVVHAHVNLPKE